MSQGRYELRTATDWHVFTTNSITIDLTTHGQGPLDGVGNSLGRACRTIIVTKAGIGTLVLKKLNGTAEKVTGILSGQELPGQVTKIRGVSSSFSEIVVYW